MVDSPGLTFSDQADDRTVRLLRDLEADVRGRLEDRRAQRHQIGNLLVHRASHLFEAEMVASVEGYLSRKHALVYLCLARNIDPGSGWCNIYQAHAAAQLGLPITAYRAYEDDLVRAGLIRKRRCRRNAGLVRDLYITGCRAVDDPRAAGPGLAGLTTFDILIIQAYGGGAERVSSLMACALKEGWRPCKARSCHSVQRKRISDIPQGKLSVDIFVPMRVHTEPDEVDVPLYCQVPDLERDLDTVEPRPAPESTKEKVERLSRFPHFTEQDKKIHSRNRLDRIGWRATRNSIQAHQAQARELGEKASTDPSSLSDEDMAYLEALRYLQKRDTPFKGNPVLSSGVRLRERASPASTTTSFPISALSPDLIHHQPHPSAKPYTRIKCLKSLKKNSDCKSAGLLSFSDAKINDGMTKEKEGNMAGGAKNGSPSWAEVREWSPRQGGASLAEAPRVADREEQARLREELARAQRVARIRARIKNRKPPFWDEQDALEKARKATEEQRKKDDRWYGYWDKRLREAMPAPLPPYIPKGAAPGETWELLPGSSPTEECSEEEYAEIEARAEEEARLYDLED
jgi:DNA-binding MarR family transcriptional regulator